MPQCAAVGQPRLMPARSRSAHSPRSSSSLPYRLLRLYSCGAERWDGRERALTTETQCHMQLSWQRHDSSQRPSSHKQPAQQRKQRPCLSGQVALVGHAGAWRRQPAAQEMIGMKDCWPSETGRPAESRTPTCMSRHIRCLRVCVPAPNRRSRLHVRHPQLGQLRHLGAQRAPPGIALPALPAKACNSKGGTACHGKRHNRSGGGESNSRSSGGAPSSSTACVVGSGGGRRASTSSTATSPLDSFTVRTARVGWATERPAGRPAGRRRGTAHSCAAARGRAAVAPAVRRADRGCRSAKESAPSISGRAPVSWVSLPCVEC